MQKPSLCDMILIFAIRKKLDLLVKKNQKAFTLYHFKLIVRLVMLVWAIGLYIFDGNDLITSNTVFFTVVWGLFMLEMILKLFPLKYESMGSQKQFKVNFEPVRDKVHAKIENQKRALLIAVLWILLNAVIAHFHFKHVIDTGIMVLLSLFYSVCDMICVMFFCPFQHIMGNRCCTTCRIHNWDYVMMFTPLVFIDNMFALSLFVFGLVIFVRWEYTVWKYPERFCEKTNINLACAKCKDIRCTRKGMK